jgi:hypothetical protein
VGYPKPRSLFSREMSSDVRLLPAALIARLQCLHIANVTLYCRRCKDETVFYLCIENKFTVIEDRSIMVEL